MQLCLHLSGFEQYRTTISSHLFLLLFKSTINIRWYSDTIDSPDYIPGVKGDQQVEAWITREVHVVNEHRSPSCPQHFSHP